MYHSIAIPLDGSDFGEQALPYALAIARASGGVLHLVHVHNGRYAHESEYLGKLSARIAREHGLPTTAVPVDGTIADEIERAVAPCAADLIVMATHARGALASFWFGGIAHKLIRSVAVPVLLINPHQPMPQGLPEYGFRKVVVALDGSPLAEEI